VRVRFQDRTEEGAAIGVGPVDALCRAIAQVTGTSARLHRYEIRAVTSGTEAMGEVTVQLEDAGRRVVGRGASTDVIEASAKAYIDGLNKLASLVRLIPAGEKATAP
jgi:2-isopropylmalate synthase